MSDDKKRKEVQLDNDTIILLQSQADKQGRKLKNYMEHILREKAHSYELSDSYKMMMDKMLDQNEKGELTFRSLEDVKSQFSID